MSDRELIRMDNDLCRAEERITTLLAVIEQCRSALESCHALQVHGEVITKEECNLCRVLEVIKEATQ